MLELPESRHIAKQVKENLLGKTVKNLIANQSPHTWAWLYGDPAAYHDKAVGRTITGTNAYGGMPEITFDDARLVAGDGTNIRFYAKDEKLPPKHQLLIEFEDGSALVYSVQMYGGVWLMSKDDPDDGYMMSAKTRISPVSKENTEDYFFGLMDEVKQNYSIKAFLATEQRFPGLGNGVLQDILFNARVNPRRKLATLSQNEKESVYTNVKTTLTEMTDAGGRDTEKDIFGLPGGYKTKLSAKTKGMPCPVCGGIIVKEAFMGGSVYYCPICQPL